MIQPNGIGAEQPLHSLHQIGIGSFKDQVKVIAHQTIGMYLPTRFVTGFGQGPKKVLPINIVMKNILAPVSATHDMINGAGVLHSQFAWHELIKSALGHEDKQNINMCRLDPFFLELHEKERGVQEAFEEERSIAKACRGGPLKDQG